MENLKPESKPVSFLKKYWPLIVAAILLATFGYSYVNESSKSSTKIKAGMEEIARLKEAYWRLSFENKDLSKQIAEKDMIVRNLRKELNSQSNLEIYDEHGVLRKRRSASSSSTEVSSEEVQKLRSENFTLALKVGWQENLIKDLQERSVGSSEEETASESKTIKKRGSVVLGLGATHRAEPSALLQSTLLGPFGVAGSAWFSTIPFSISGGAVYVTGEF